MPMEETIFMIGESRTNLDNAITKLYGTFYIAFEIEPDSGRIIDVDCSHTLALTKDFIRRIFINKNMVLDAEMIDAEVKRRYFGSSVKAIMVAYRDALKRYQSVKESDVQL